MPPQDGVREEKPEEMRVGADVALVQWMGGSQVGQVPVEYGFESGGKIRSFGQQNLCR